MTLCRSCRYKKAQGRVESMHIPQPNPYISVFWGFGRLLHTLNTTFCFWQGVIPTSCFIFYACILGHWAHYDPQGMASSCMRGHLLCICTVVSCCEVVCEGGELEEGGWRVVSGGGDGLVKLWDVKHGRELLSMAGHTAEVVYTPCSKAYTLTASSSISLHIDSVYSKPHIYR